MFFLSYITGFSSRLPLAFPGFTLAKVVSGFTIGGGHVVLHGFHGLVYIQSWLTKVLFVMYYRCGFHIIIVLPSFRISQGRRWAFTMNGGPCGSSFVWLAGSHVAYKCFICYISQISLPGCHWPSVISHWPSSTVDGGPCGFSWVS